MAAAAATVRLTRKRNGGGATAAVIGRDRPERTRTSGKPAVAGLEKTPQEMGRGAPGRARSPGAESSRGPSPSR